MYCTVHNTDTDTAQVLECDEFYGLTPQQVAQLIASDSITVPSEEKVCTVFIRSVLYCTVLLFRCLKV